jgi:hypothetical protein
VAGLATNQTAPKYGSLGPIRDVACLCISATNGNDYCHMSRLKPSVLSLTGRT